ncbi:MAG: extracellular solute-binding protein [Clostridia bacterium]|nr:extracellular solute-binding protein [Clostridia bacterium]
MKKAVVSVFLSAAIITSFASCGKKQGGTRETDENTLSYWVAMPPSIVSQFKSLNELPMYQELEKRTGVHIDFIHPPTGQVNEQFSLMLASKDYPDMIEASWVIYPGGQAKAIKDNVIIPLNDIMPKCAPDAWGKITGNPLFDRLSKTDDGDYYMFPYLNDSNFRIFGGLMLRADWLKELNLSVPTTIDEWETVLTAFKEKKGATAPFTAQSALVNGSYSVNAFNGAFDVGKRIYVDDGEVKFGPMEDSYKDWLTLMNKWYKTGLLDVDYATNDSSAVISKMSNGEAGATFGFVGGTLGPLLQIMEDKDPNFDLVAAPYLSKNNDGKPGFAALESDVVDSGSLVITTACSNPELAAKWANNFYTEDGEKLRSFGVENESYTVDEDNQIKFTDEILNNENGVSVVEMAQRYARTAEACPGYGSQKNMENLYEQIYKYDRQIEAFGLWSEATDSAREHLFPAITAVSDEADEFSALNIEICTYLDEMIFKFVNGTEPLENFDQFRENLKKLNVERYIEIQSNAYKKFLER